MSGDQPQPRVPAASAYRGAAGLERELPVEDYLQIPFAMSIWSRRNERGEWVRHVEYPELPGCVVEGPRIVEAMEGLEALKTAHILDCLARGEPIPVPRPPLRA